MMRCILMVGIAAFGIAACGGGEGAAPANEASMDGGRPQSGRRERNVRVQTVRPDTLTLVSRLPATIRPLRHASLSFQEAGTVSEVERDLGDRVSRGDVLARLDAKLLEAAATEAEAGLKFQRYNYDRARQLYDEGTISEQDYFASEYEWKRAESAAQTIRERLERAVLRAPFDGAVAYRAAQTGDVVAPGTTVYELVQADTVKAEAWVPDTDIADFEAGREVSIGLDAFPGKTFRGTVDRIGPAADPSRRVFPIEVILPNAGSAMRPGMIGRLEAVRRTYHDVLVIPREAVQQREQGPVAFVQEIDGDGSTVARVRTLALGPSEGNRVIVRDGIAFGDRVIVAGARDLFDGEGVTVREDVE